MVGTPNYYVQQLFSRNRGDVVLPATLTGTSPAANGQPRVYATASQDAQAGEVILKVVNAQAEAVKTAIRIKGAGRLKATGTAITLSGGLSDENSLDNPKRVSPATSPVSGVGQDFTYTFKPYSMTVLRLGRAN